MYVFFRFGAWRSCCLETYNQCFGFRSILDQTLLLCTDIKKYFRMVPNIYVPQVPALLSKYRHDHFQNCVDSAPVMLGRSSRPFISSSACV
jgi:hypothetical protein